MESESESSVDTRELLPREVPITYNRYGSLVALVAEDESSETQENVNEADERVETSWNWSGERTFYFLTVLLYNTFLLLLHLPVLLV